jgi:hypothetical protein
VTTFVSGVVVDVLSEREGLQRVTVDLGRGDAEPAYVLTQLSPPASGGDRVVVNTTAVDLGLGTGGWHVVHWNLEYNGFGSPPGHVMKLRYTPVQLDVDAPGAARVDLNGLPVVVCELHSQVAAVAVALHHGAPDAELAYVMTDHAALPIALSDLVHELRQRRLITRTITCGHAFGGDREAVSIFDALALAEADAVVVAPGPGGVGTGTDLGFSAIGLGAAIDAAAGLGATPIVALRASNADPRDRHRGVSHHSVTLLTTGTHGRATVAVPPAVEVPPGIVARHNIERVDPLNIIAMLDKAGLDVWSMGRPAAADPLLFECAAAAGNRAAQHLT